MRRFVKYWLPVVVYAGAIFFVSSLPGKDIPSLFPYQDILFHFLEYAVFALLINRAVKGYNQPTGKWRRFAAVVAMVFTYALLDEFHQSFVPGRTASLFDVMIDTAGTCLAAYFA